MGLISFNQLAFHDERAISFNFILKGIVFKNLKLATPCFEYPLLCYRCSKDLKCLGSESWIDPL